MTRQRSIFDVQRSHCGNVTSTPTGLKPSRAAAGGDPHHLIGHGFGGTGTKEGDFHVMPLCRICHRELHDNVTVWERQHSSQLEHIPDCSTARWD
ncbi:DUF968 domain-containing protein [Kluyvera sichuanensis]|uniref:DUF968 domain-containing protein n=1 Tax=Kluyvera sichuanensis TaxID=2725494 RepID=UPI0039F46536